jgi:hypothetical protein
MLSSFQRQRVARALLWASMAETGRKGSPEAVLASAIRELAAIIGQLDQTADALIQPEVRREH